MLNDKNCVIALGNFDGLHIGHRKVISLAVEMAKKLNLQAKVLIFDKHPFSSLGRKEPKSIMEKDALIKKIEDMGAECIEIDFGKIMNMSGEDFVRELLIDEFSAKAVCCGFNYHFGKDAKWNVQDLEKICSESDTELIVCPKVTYKGETVSSSRIRNCLAIGNMKDANAMLGENFGYDFLVVGGDRLGRKLGSPTINQIFPENFAVPLFGVYVSKTYVDGKEYKSVTNIGVRPTVNGSALRSETYIIDFSGDLYGKRIQVSIEKYLRSERKFSSVEELKSQIQFDSKKARGNKSMEKLNVKAVFFDFDDTLQSRRGAYRLYCENFLDKYFPNIDKAEREKKLDEMEKHVDGGYKEREEYFPELIELWDWENHPPMQELYDSFNEDYGKFVVMLPYAIDVLEEVKQRGYTMGIISNGVSVLQNTKLDTAGIRDMFDVIVVSGDFGVYKPDRSIFDEACRQAGLSNEDCLFVGDHPINDIKGALGADMKVVRMNQGDFYNKDIDSRIPTIEDLRELLQLLG